ncbi:hypothetical protein BN946_scf184785.g20 [Trametes cinnabarina]|uniref:Uncharacterized protein n=1 Tax=Pycnoporus cinnabarinus TaxID=5643 RepID=A0A060S586_PYCCI|nr:hypothetical protein BN946_scf184785.g20 [Trametes cinnabarina]
MSCKAVPYVDGEQLSLEEHEPLQPEPPRRVTAIVGPASTDLRSREDGWSPVGAVQQESTADDPSGATAARRFASLADKLAAAVSVSPLRPSS